MEKSTVPSITQKILDGLALFVRRIRADGFIINAPSLKLDLAISSSIYYIPNLNTHMALESPNASRVKAEKTKKETDEAV